MINKEMTVENLTSKLNRISHELDMLDTESEKVRDDAKVAYAGRIVVLRARWYSLRELLIRIDKPGSDDLNKLVNQFYVARKALEARIRELKQEYFGYEGG